MWALDSEVILRSLYVVPMSVTSLDGFSRYEVQRQRLACLGLAPPYSPDFERGLGPAWARTYDILVPFPFFLPTRVSRFALDLTFHNKHNPSILNSAQPEWAAFFHINLKLPNPGYNLG